jgi:hypothetical protein
MEQHQQPPSLSARFARRRRSYHQPSTRPRQRPQPRTSTAAGGGGEGADSRDGGGDGFSPSRRAGSFRVQRKRNSAAEPEFDVYDDDDKVRKRKKEIERRNEKVHECK